MGSNWPFCALSHCFYTEYHTWHLNEFASNNLLKLYENCLQCSSTHCTVLHLNAIVGYTALVFADKSTIQLSVGPTLHVSLQLALIW